jgi:hypothetical protein
MKTKMFAYVWYFAVVLLLAAMLFPVAAHAIDKSLEDIVGQLPRLDYPGARTQIPTLLVLMFTAVLTIVLLILLLRGRGWVFWPFFLFASLSISWLFGLWLPVFFLGIPVLGAVRKRVAVRNQQVQVTYYTPPAETYVQQTRYVEKRVKQPVVSIFLVHNTHHSDFFPETPQPPEIRGAEPGYLVAPDDDEEV